MSSFASPEAPTLPIYPCRRGDIGSILVTRRAGTQQAIPAANATNAVAIQMCDGFPNSKPGRKVRRNCIATNARPSPIASAIATVMKPCRNTKARTQGHAFFLF